jgi:hypothetical protein
MVEHSAEHQEGAMAVGREAGPGRVPKPPLKCVMCGENDAIPDRAVCDACSAAGYPEDEVPATRGSDGPS